MIAIFDTSSFECIMKHYIPIDKKGELKSIIEENFQEGQFILIDKVYYEIWKWENSLVLKEFPILKDRKLRVSTDNIIPNGIFFSHLDDFIDPKIANSVKKPLTEAEIELAKNKYLNDPDGRILIYAHSILSENPIIITEETVRANDGKLMRKIPYNASFLGLRCMSFPELLKEKFSVHISREIKNPDSF